MKKVAFLAFNFILFIIFFFSFASVFTLELAPKPYTITQFFPPGVYNYTGGKLVLVSPNPNNVLIIANNSVIIVNFTRYNSIAQIPPNYYTVTIIDHNYINLVSYYYIFSLFISFLFSLLLVYLIDKGLEYMFERRFGSTDYE